MASTDLISVRESTAGCLDRLLAPVRFRNDSNEAVAVRLYLKDVWDRLGSEVCTRQNQLWTVVDKVVGPQKHIQCGTDDVMCVITDGARKTVAEIPVRSRVCVVFNGYA